MKTAQEILRKHVMEDFLNTVAIHKAMEEYAKEVALHFDYWKKENFRKVMPNGYESNIIDGTKNYQRRYTTHELFELFEENKT